METFTSVTSKEFASLTHRGGLQRIMALSNGGTGFWVESTGKTVKVFVSRKEGVTIHRFTASQAARGEGVVAELARFALLTPFANNFGGWVTEDGNKVGGYTSPGVDYFTTVFHKGDVVQLAENAPRRTKIAKMLLATL